ncbi:hypothetical protein AB1Y20_018341 [Prymnesium parvum]|uniref:peptidylprolyl isomerase n=1 Tax=Prymnesium parvum TaxID=97485 RepID=A0AB34JNY0_PRYPA
MASAWRLLLLVSLPVVHAKACAGENLPKDAGLRIGVKHKPEECAVRSKPGDWLSMHYTGKLYSDCSTFDSSVERGEPFKFKLGRGEVIKGWDEGLRGMCIGEKRKLTIPSDLAYGDEGSGSTIPGGSTLQFEVQLLDIQADEPKKKKKKSKKKKKKSKDEV